MNLVGKKFTRWLVLGKDSKDKHGRWMWKCQCECGIIKPVAQGNLVNGKSKSCGCWDRESAALRMTTHGHSADGKRSAENRAYHQMISRCENTNRKDFHNYGGRGIKVCDEWRGPNGFIKFYEHIGPKPSQKYTLDRIDVNGNYEPNNVRWADRRTQTINQRLRKKNETGIAGVWFNKLTNRWISRICVNYKSVHLLTTKDFFEACCARKSAELIYGGYA